MTYSLKSSSASFPREYERVHWKWNPVNCLWLIGAHWSTCKPQRGSLSQPPPTLRHLSLSQFRWFLSCTYAPSPGGGTAVPFFKTCSTSSFQSPCLDSKITNISLKHFHFVLETSRDFHPLTIFKQRIHLVCNLRLFPEENQFKKYLEGQAAFYYQGKGKQCIWDHILLSISNGLDGQKEASHLFRNLWCTD